MLLVGKGEEEEEEGEEGEEEGEEEEGEEEAEAEVWDDAVLVRTRKFSGREAKPTAGSEQAEDSKRWRTVLRGQAWMDEMGGRR